MTASPSDPLSGNNVLNPQRPAYLDRTAFFGALCLFFSALEYLFPRPVPFFRLGLANLPILLAIDILPFPYLLLLGLLKVLGQGLLHGTLASYVVLFSLGGTFSSLFAMYLARKLPGLSFIGVSIIGAMFSNTVQVALSLLIVFGANADLIIPYFFTMGLISGTAIGIFANWFTSGSKWYQSLLQNKPFHPPPREEERSPKGRRRNRPDRLASFLNPKERFVTGLLLLIPLVFQPDPLFRAVHLILLGVLCVLAGKRMSWFYFLNLMFWITLFQQLTPFGRVLFQFQEITVTAGALESGLQKSMLLIGLVFTSLFSVTPGLRLPGMLGGVIGKMFYYFEELSAGKGKIRRKTFIADVDAVLGNCGTASSADSGDTGQRKKNMSRRERRIPAAPVIILLFYAVWGMSLVL